MQNIFILNIILYLFFKIVNIFSTFYEDNLKELNGTHGDAVVSIPVVSEFLSVKADERIGLEVAFDHSFKMQSYFDLGITATEESFPSILKLVYQIQVVIDVFIMHNTEAVKFVDIVMVDTVPLVIGTELASVVG